MTYSVLPLVGLDALYTMLTYRRPHGSKAEKAFINRFIRPHIDYEDEEGNLFKQVGEDPTVLFSSHTDSVHRQGGQQRLLLGQEDGWITAEGSDCLGADCAAGVWLMLEMIRAEVPGLYVFHRQEECGGVGSNYIARHTPHMLEGIQAAIAFDRKGFSSVITHQHGQRCCSEAFAQSLAGILPGIWDLDDTGSFTDTANYVDLIGECTNISVGYLDQHRSNERLNVFFLEKLRDGLIAADWSQIVIERKPGDPDPEWKRWASIYRSKAKRDPFQELLAAVKAHPEAAANLLWAHGRDALDIDDEIMRGWA